MPTIKVEWIVGRTVEQKRELAAAIAPLVAKISNTTIDRVKVEFHDIPEENIAWGGVLRCDERAQKKS